jgi:uncharacterized repeat protein (TIGR03803 family)
MSKLGFVRFACIVSAFCIAAVAASPAQIFSSISLDGTDGQGSTAPEQGADGNFYGVTAGGANREGTVYELTLEGKIITLYNFCSQTDCIDGEGPSGIIQAADGNLYGTTYGGGPNRSQDCDGCGTVFKITPSGTFTSLYSFCSQANCADGLNPSSGLVQASNGNFYGTTPFGGANNHGTVFEITPAGKLTTLYSFCPQTNCPDGAEPYPGLTLATNGSLYGTTSFGGANESGAIFEITPAGKFTTLYSFTVYEALPNSLIQAADGTFYGTTQSTGTTGTVFHFIPPGNVTTLYTFCSIGECYDGSNPNAPVAQGTDGNLYGTTLLGGRGEGTIFRVTPEGTLTTLHYFCSQKNCADGSMPRVGLLQATDGIFYGAASSGGTREDGTIYTLNLSLAPFVEPIPNFGPVGQVVRIQGNNLAGTTSVTFNGTPATTFTVVSDTYIKATVPTGASSGTILVTSPSGTLSSNVAFQVLQ